MLAGSGTISKTIHRPNRVYQTKPVVLVSARRWFDPTGGRFSAAACSGHAQRIWKHEPTFSIAREFVDLANCREVQRSIYVRKECVGALVAGMRCRFVDEPRGKLSFFETNNHQTALPAVEEICGLHHLRCRRAVNEALGFEASGHIFALSDGIFPVVTLYNVQNHQTADSGRALQTALGSFDAAFRASPCKPHLHFAIPKRRYFHALALDPSPSQVQGAAQELGDIHRAACDANREFATRAMQFYGFVSNDRRVHETSPNSVSSSMTQDCSPSNPILLTGSCAPSAGDRGVCKSSRRPTKTGRRTGLKRARVGRRGSLTRSRCISWIALRWLISDSRSSRAPKDANHQKRASASMIVRRRNFPGLLGRRSSFLRFFLPRAPSKVEQFHHVRQRRGVELPAEADTFRTSCGLQSHAASVSQWQNRICANPYNFHR